MSLMNMFISQLPTIIADNAGYDSADLVAQLRAAHQENKTTFGLGEFWHACIAISFITNKMCILAVFLLVSVNQL